MRDGLTCPAGGVRRFDLRSASQIRVTDAVATLGLMLVLMSAFRPAIVDQLSMGIVYNSLDRCVFLALLTYPLVTRWPPSRVSVAVAFFCLVICVSSCINGNLEQYAVYSYARIALFAYYLQVQFERFPRRLLKASFFVLAVICFCDFISIVLYPDGLYRDVRFENEYYTANLGGWVLGLKNNHVLWYLSLGLVSSLLDWEKWASLRPSLRTVVCFVSSIMATVTMGSSTSSVVLFTMFALLCIAPVLRHSRKLFNLGTVCLTLLAAWAFLVLSTNLSVLNDLMLSLFGKDASFSGRSLAWSETISMIAKSPLLGYGLQSTAQRVAALGSVEYVNAHNQLLELLYVGGLPLASIAAILPSLVMRCPNGRHAGDEHRVFVCSALLALGIEMLFEVIMTTPAFWFIVVLAQFGCLSAVWDGDRCGEN